MFFLLNYFIKLIIWTIPSLNKTYFFFIIIHSMNHEISLGFYFLVILYCESQWRRINVYRMSRLNYSWLKFNLTVELLRKLSSTGHVSVLFWLVLFTGLIRRNVKQPDKQNQQINLLSSNVHIFRRSVIHKIKNIFFATHYCNCNLVKEWTNSIKTNRFATQNMLKIEIFHHMGC